MPGPLSPRMQAWEHVGILCPPRGEIKACLRQSAPSSGFRFTVGGTNPTTSLKRRPHQSVQGFVLLASTKTPPSWGDDRRYCIAPQRRNQSLLRCRGRTCRSQDPGLRRHPLRGPWQKGGSFFFTRVPYCENLPHRTAEGTQRADTGRALRTAPGPRSPMNASCDYCPHCVCTQKRYSPYVNLHENGLCRDRLRCAERKWEVTEGE